MKTFDIETFEKNKDEENIYIYTIDGYIYEESSGLSDGNYIRYVYKSSDYFKAFYFAEPGGDSGLLSGFSHPGGEYVVVFSSANDQTASHEFLHALNLAHSFANNEADSNAEFTYKYKETDNLLDYSHHISGHENDRCSLWYWQWVKANNSI